MIDFILLGIILFLCVMIIIGYVRSYRRGEQTGCMGDCRHCAIECGGSYKYAMRMEQNSKKRQRQIRDGLSAYRRETGHAWLIDVRSPKEYRADHLPGSINIPLPQIDRIVSVVHDPSLPVYLYGGNGHQSEKAAEKVRALGYTKIVDIGGILYRQNL